jgi:hypothetical protein
MSIECAICGEDGAEQKSGAIYFCPNCKKLFKALPHLLGIEIIDEVDIKEEHVIILKEMLTGPKAEQTRKILKSLNLWNNNNTHGVEIGLSLI